MKRLIATAGLLVVMVSCMVSCSSKTAEVGALSSGGPVVTDTASVAKDARQEQPLGVASAPPPSPVANEVQGGVVGGVVGGVIGGVVGGTPAGYAYAPATIQQSKLQYAHVEEHAFADTKNAQLTTFSIDVDRASYANVRRFLAAGQVPPPDAVRIEEMINYFTYSYPQPAGREPFSITTEVAGCPWNTNNRLLRIGIQGRNLEQWKMAPNNLVFLLDVSGSMQPPQRLPLIKSAFRVLVDQLRAEDKVSIVVYSGAAGRVLPPTSGADKATILAALDQLQAGGSTAGGEGIELAYKTAQENFLADGNNRVILATDGDFNVGISSIEELNTLIEAKRKSGIFLSVIGVGDDNYQDAMMESLADKGNGNFSYLDSLKEAEKVFKTELTGTLVTIAKDVKVQLEFNPALVASYRQIGYENRALNNEDFDDDTKDAGELGAGHSVTALYEIVPVASGSAGELATLRLRYKEPHGETSQLLTAKAIDNGKSAYAASADLQFAAAVAELGMLLRNSAHKGTSSFADVAQLARASRGVDLDGTREEFMRLTDTSRALVQTRVATQ
ncbi:MAG TPA: VWA domain-containing protein [Thermoanaerobaculia bacterium]|nr:VWA domain-containing protein [Thermoanaerobaculia bacterium]